MSQRAAPTECGSDLNEEESRPTKRLKRCSNACHRCKSRKQRCDGNEPCGNCVSAKTQCVFEEPQSRRHNSVSVNYIAALEDRCAHLESTLRQVDPCNKDVQDHFRQNQLRKSSTEVEESIRALRRAPSPARLCEVTSSPLTARPNDADAVGNDDDHMLHQSPEAIGTAAPVVIAPDRPAAETDIQDVLDNMSLKAFARAPYVGNSLTKFLKTAMKIGQTLSPTPYQVMPPKQTPGSVPISSGIRLLQPPSDDMAELFYQATFRHVQCRYPFMQWPLFLSWHERRAELCVERKKFANRNDRAGAFFCWMIYAIGARHSTSGLRNEPLRSEQYYEASRFYLEDVLSCHDLLTIQALGCLAMYSFRTPNGPSVWHMVGYAMRICIEYGLHRKTPSVSRESNPLLAEIKSRNFWSIYTLDRLVGTSLGRPFAIADNDIDAEEPLDVDCFETNPDVIRAAYANRALLAPRQGVWPTSMTACIHTIRLHRIRSDIVNSTKIPPNTLLEPVPSSILRRLERWKQEVPLPDSNTPPEVPMISRARSMKNYHMAMLLALRHRVDSSNDSNDSVLGRVADSAAESCELSKQLLDSEIPAYSLADLYETFLAGVTLLNAIATRRDIIPAKKASRGIRAASSVLVGYSTLFPEAQSFRDMFDELVDVMDDEPPRPADVLTRSVASSDIGASNGNAMKSIWEKKAQDLGGLLPVNLREDFGNLVTCFGYTPLAMTDQARSIGTNMDSNAMPISLTGDVSDTMNFGSGLDFNAPFDQSMMLQPENQSEQWLYDFM